MKFLNSACKIQQNLLLLFIIFSMKNVQSFNIYLFTFMQRYKLHLFHIIILLWEKQNEYFICPTPAVCLQILPLWFALVVLTCWIHDKVTSHICTYICKYHTFIQIFFSYIHKHNMYTILPPPVQIISITHHIKYLNHKTLHVVTD